MTGKKPIVKIRVYRGKELNYDSKGNVKNENFLISIEYRTNLWKLTMKNLKLNGYCKVEVDSVYIEQKDGSYIQEKNIESFEKEVKDSFEAKESVALTPEQKRIAELEAKLEALLSGKTKVEKKEEKKVEKVIEEKVSIDDLKEEYFKLSEGKKPHHFWKEDRLKQEIDKLK